MRERDKERALKRVTEQVSKQDREMRGENKESKSGIQRNRE